MMHLDDVKATGLIQFGARIRYHLLLAGGERELRPTGNGWNARLTRVSGWKMPAMPAEIRSVLDRAERFLGLAPC